MRIMSYNILAPTYARPDRYPFTDRDLLTWEARRDRLTARLRGSGADVICLQEVEAYIFQYLQGVLEPYGLEGIYAQKRQGRPDGCATFYNTERVVRLASRAHHYCDGDGECDSGHVALIARLEADGRAMTAINTHIRWGSPDERGRAHIGYRQVSELLDKVISRVEEPCIVCGDFNAEPARDLIQRMLSHGLSDAYAGAPQPTANSDRKAKRIDYIFHSSALTSQPAELPPIGDETPLPSETEPSDHLPISADISLV